MGFQPKLLTVVSFSTTLFVTVYYLTGAVFIPTSLILVAAAQVLFQGALAFDDLLLHALAHISLRRPLPLELISLAVLQMSTRISPSTSLVYVLLNAFVSLFLVHTPEVLLTALATNSLDIRYTSLSHTTTELASFGGGFDRSTYYTAGLVLLASTTPDDAYLEIAYQIPHTRQWIVPRKPVLWYTHFKYTLSRENDLEDHLYVPENQVAVLTPVPRSDVLPGSCQVQNYSDFGYFLAASSCPDGVFGFDVGGPTLEPESTFFRLTAGVASVRYSSRRNLRTLYASNLREEVTVPVFPRHGQLMRDMHRAFLNAISFNRVSSSISVAERLALSSLVRIAGFEDASGFSDPGEIVDAELRTVRLSEVSRYLVLTMALSVALIAVAETIFTFSDKILSRELGQWIKLCGGLTSARVLSAYPRERKEKLEAIQRGKLLVNLVEDSKGLKFQQVQGVCKDKIGGTQCGEIAELAGQNAIAIVSGGLVQYLSENGEGY